MPNENEPTVEQVQDALKWLDRFKFDSSPNGFYAEVVQIELRRLKAEVKRLTALCGSAHSELDKLMGDSDLPNDNSELIKLMQQLAKYL